MKPGILWSLLFTIITSLNLNAQSGDKYLVSIALDASTDRARLEALHLPIYHYFEHALIAGVPEERVEALRSAGIPFTTIDRAPWSEKYYLISCRKPHVMPGRFSSANLLFADESQALVKCLSIEELQLDRSVFTYAEVPQVPHLFVNEQIIQKYHSSPASDSSISRVISEIRADSVRNYIQHLQDFNTRYYLAPTRDSVSYWIQRQFLAMGYTDVVIDSFQYQATWQKNVVATLPGTSMPERIIVIGGHHDSYSNGDRMVYAPGADDNASGAIAALEIARAMKRSNYRPEVTIKFMTFAAEEAGLRGSAILAQRAKAAGSNIILMINHDMISYTTKTVDNSNVTVSYYSGFEHLRDAAMGLVNRFTLLTSLRGGGNSSGSDSYSFWSNGYPAIYFLSTEFSPFYHSASDVIANYNMAYCAEVIKASCAMAMYYAGVLQTVRNVTVADVGDGTSLLVRWNRNLEPTLSGYYVRVGRASGKYDTLLTTIDTTLVVHNCIDGIRYFIGVSAYDAHGNESFISEQTGIPHLVPLAPSNLVADPQWHKVALHWNQNRELDVAGYNIYRAKSPSDPPTRVSPLLFTDTTYVDSTTENGTMYLYSVTATDRTQKESSPTIPVRSRAVSLDQGILVADETLGGDGTLLKPTDAQVDSFYSRMLTGFTTQVYDVEAHGKASLADLGAFSTVVWHGDDFTSLSAALNSQQDLRRYLNYGGRLFISCFRPVAAFGNSTSYPRDFSPGEFVYDCLKIRHAENKFLARFIGAVSPLSVYPPVFVDTSKTPPSTGYHLLQIEGIDAVPGASDIYLYETQYDTSTVEGRMKGQPVGVEYLGSDFKVVVLSFPLYYMKFDAAKSLTRFVLMNRFAEPTATVEEPSALPTQSQLSQNYPNPFNPTTKLGFGISDLGFVTLKVYDILGREVATLVNEVKQPGTYTVQFDARLPGTQGPALASGVYFYQLSVSPLARRDLLPASEVPKGQAGVPTDGRTGRAGAFVQTRKLMIVK